jgi:hypothetical protein
MTPEQLEQIRDRLRPHRADQAAMEASTCYEADTCTLDPSCPFSVHCLEVEERNP